MTSRSIEPAAPGLPVRAGPAGPAGPAGHAGLSRPAADHPPLPPAWLRAQLPRVMADDEFLARFLAGFEEIAATVRAGIDGLEQQLDATLAAPAMLRYTASWLGLDLDPNGAVADQRELVRAMGPLLGWRGTRRGLEGLLQALTGSRVRVEDGGGVFTSKEEIPPADLRITVRLDHCGDYSPAQVRAFIAEEVPVGSEVELVVGRA